MFGTLYPKLTTKTAEGAKVGRLSLEAERSADLATAAKDWNRARNGGVLKCEAFCPTCHRWADAKAENKLTPLLVNNIAPSMAAAASLKTAAALDQSC